MASICQLRAMAMAMALVVSSVTVRGVVDCGLPLGALFQIGSDTGKTMKIAQVELFGALLAGHSIPIHMRIVRMNGAVGMGLRAPGSTAFILPLGHPSSAWETISIPNSSNSSGAQTQFFFLEYFRLPKGAKPTQYFRKMG